MTDSQETANRATVLTPPSVHHGRDDGSESSRATVPSTFINPQPTLRPDTNYPAAIGQTSLRTCSLFLPVNGDQQIQMADVGVRQQQYTKAQVETQLNQFANDPHQSLAGIPVHFLVYTQVIDHDKDTDPRMLTRLKPPKEDEERYMAPTTVDDALELMNIVTFGVEEETPKAPPGYDMDEPSHIVSWALQVADSVDTATLYGRVMEYCRSINSEHYKKDWRERLEMWSDEYLQKQLTGILQTIQHIRLAPIRGKRRAYVAFYIFTGLLSSLGFDSETELETASGEPFDLTQIRNNIDSHRNHYSILFFAPPLTEEAASTFTSEEVVMCLGYGFEGQTNLDNAESLGIGDRAIYAVNSMALLDDDCKPWNYFKGNAWIGQRLKRFAKTSYVSFADYPNLPTIKTGDGVIGKLKSELQFPIRYHLMLLKYDTRRQWIADWVPVNFQDRVIKEMDKSLDKQWDQKDKVYQIRNAREALNNACCFIISHTAMLLTHSVSYEQQPLEPIIRAWKLCPGDGSGTQRDAELKMYKLTMMIIKAYIFPYLAIVEGTRMIDNKHKDDSRRSLNKDQWVWYCSQAQLYREISLIIDEPNDLHKSIFSFCMLLAKNFKEKKIGGTSHILEKKVKGKCGPSESRIYPDVELDRFQIRIVHIDENNKRKRNHPITLRDLLYQCHRHLTRKDSDNGSNNGDESTDDVSDDGFHGSHDGFDWPAYLGVSPDTTRLEDPSETFTGGAPAYEREIENKKRKGSRKGQGGRKRRKVSDYTNNVTDEVRSCYSQVLDWLKGPNGKAIDAALSYAFGKKEKTNRYKAIQELAEPPKEDEDDGGDE